MAVRKRTRKVNTAGKNLKGYTVDSFTLDVIKMAELNKAQNLAKKEYETHKAKVEERMNELKLKKFRTEATIQDVYSSIDLEIAPKNVGAINMTKLKKLCTAKQYDAMVTTSMKAIENEVGKNIKDQVVSYALGDPAMGMKIKKTTKPDEG